MPASAGGVGERRNLHLGAELPAPFSAAPLPRHGRAAFPPRVITALPQTHAREMKYSSRTYWLLQRLLGKANETDSRKEMSVRCGAGWRGVDKGGQCPQVDPLPVPASGGFASHSWCLQPSISGPTTTMAFPNPRAPTSSGRMALRSFAQHQAGL